MPGNMCIKDLSNPLCPCFWHSSHMKMAFRRLKKQSKDVGWPSSENPWVQIGTHWQTLVASTGLGQLWQGTWKMQTYCSVRVDARRGLLFYVCLETQSWAKWPRLCIFHFCMFTSCWSVACSVASFWGHGLSSQVSLGALHRHQVGIDLQIDRLLVLVHEHSSPWACMPLHSWALMWTLLCMLGSCW